MPHRVPSGHKKTHEISRFRAKAGAGNGTRTRYLHLGKVALYQMSYAREGLSVIIRGFGRLSRAVFENFCLMKTRLANLLPLSVRS